MGPGAGVVGHLRVGSIVGDFKGLEFQNTYALAVCVLRESYQTVRV